MSAKITRNERGQLMVDESTYTNIVMVKKANRVVDDLTIEVTHFLNVVEGKAYFVLSCLQLNMLCSKHHLADGIMKLDGRAIKKDARWMEPAIMSFMEFSSDSRPYLSDSSGHVLSGSNIYSTSTLCLGETTEPFQFSCIDLLLYGKANNDLGWQGSGLTGKMGHCKNASNRKKEVFMVNNWPTINKISESIPCQIREYASAYKK